jgi:hypothetical protein
MCWQAPSCELHVHEPWHEPGDEVDNLLQVLWWYIHVISFTYTLVILCGSEFSLILLNGALCFFNHFSCYHRFGLTLALLHANRFGTQLKICLQHREQALPSTPWHSNRPRIISICIRRNTRTCVLHNVYWLLESILKSPWQMKSIISFSWGTKEIGRHGQDGPHFFQTLFH